MGTIKDRNSMVLTEAELRRGDEKTQKNYTKRSYDLCTHLDPGV